MGAWDNRALTTQWAPSMGLSKRCGHNNTVDDNHGVSGMVGAINVEAICMGTTAPWALQRGWTAHGHYRCGRSAPWAIHGDAQALALTTLWALSAWRSQTNNAWVIHGTYSLWC
jgi:hypothetical protein